MLIHHHIGNPPTPAEDWHERWEGPDHGIIASWLRGIEKSQEDPALAAKAKAGELPVLAWRGGVAKPLKKTTVKIGTLLYVATWQGLRGEDLHLDTQHDMRLTCTRTGVTVTYTGDIKRISEAAALEEDPDD